MSFAKKFMIDNNPIEISAARLLSNKEIAENAPSFKRTATGDISRTAKNITENVEGDYTETVGHKTVEAEQITEHTTKDREIDVDGNNSLHVDGANTLNIGGIHTEVFADSFSKTVNGAVIEQFKNSVNRTYESKRIINGIDSTETYTGTKRIKVGEDKFEVEGATRTVDIFTLDADETVYNIAKHGATAESDCSNIIMEGLASGQPVYIPSGVWMYSSLTLTDGQELYGIGNGSSLYSSTLENIGGNGIIIKGKNIRLHDLNIVNNKTSNNGISINKDSQFFKLENLTINKFTNGIYCNSQTWADIINVYSSENSLAGFMFENAINDNSEPMQVNVINCLAENNGKNGFYYKNNNNFAMSCGTMLNCATFNNTGNGLEYSGTGGIAAVRVANCFFGNDNNAGLVIQNAVYPCTIINCQFELAGTSATGPEKTAAGNDGKGVVITASKSALLSNCMFHTNSGIGAYIGDDSEATITGCEFYHNLYAGTRDGDLYIQNAKCIVNGNIFHSTKTAIVTATTSSGIITNNYFIEYVTAINNTTMKTVNNINKAGSIMS